MPLLYLLASLFLLLSPAVSRADSWTLEASPAEPNNWGYRPLGMAEMVNPPAFTWAPERDADRYHLQVSPSATFEYTVYEVPETPWSSHAPAAALPTGVTLYWRYRAHVPDKGWSAWSETRSFQVSKEADLYPKPSPVELMQRLPQEHPRLFMRPETVPQITERITHDLAPHWEDALRDAEMILASPPDTSEPPLYPEGIQYKSKEWRDIWWGNREHAISVMAGSATCAFAYRFTGDPRFGQMAHDLMMAFVAWDPKGSTQYDYNDEAAMPLLYWPARAYTWAPDLYTPEERERIVSVMRVRGEDCFNHLNQGNHLWRPYGSHSNRAWHWLGEVAIAFHSEIPEAARWLDFAVTVFHSCYPVWGGNDGGWHEGTAYWLSYLMRFNYWAVTMKTALDIDAYAKPFFRETGYFGMYTLPPGARAGAWGDLAQGSSSRAAGDYLGFMAAVNGNADWAWYAEQEGFNLAEKGWFGVVSGAMMPAAPAPAKPVHLPASRVFPETGLAVFNTNLFDAKQNVQVHFKSSPWGTQSHGYNANNSFMLYVNGDPLLTLTGRRDIYGSPHHSKWMWQSKSDNAILFNSEGQRPHTARALGRISGHAILNDVDIVQGEAGDSYDAVKRWTRRLYFFKPELLLIHDRVEAKQPGQWQWLLHSMAPFELSENYARTQKGEAAAEVRFLHPPALRLTQTDQFDPPPHDWAKFTLEEWHLSADPEAPAETMDFITAIAINGATANATHESIDGGFRVKVQLSDGRRYAVDLGDGTGLEARLLTAEPAPSP
ncbi:MAG: hypothetical protein RLZZ303_1380 [Candidatus Hydrogenedentota bacterium]